MTKKSIEIKKLDSEHYGSLLTDAAVEVAHAASYMLDSATETASGSTEFDADDVALLRDAIKQWRRAGDQFLQSFEKPEPKKRKKA